MHGRVDTIDANGNPIFFDVLLGADLLPQYFGHAESGNTAAVIKLDGNQHTFRALSLGHIFSISPECIDDRLVIEFTPPGRVLHDPQRVVLGRRK
jgi:hypothetical protein